jgi:archaellum component FlaC
MSEETTKETVFGFGKAFIMPLTTAQLLRVERKFEYPKNQKEELVLAGAQSELFERELERLEFIGESYEDLERKIGSLEEKLEEKLDDTSEIDELKKQLETLSKVNEDSFEGKLDLILS